MTSGDIDADCFADVAVQLNGIDILHGDGTGRFVDQVHVTDNPAEDVAIGDFDGDGLPEVVAISQSLPRSSSGVVEL